MSKISQVLLPNRFCVLFWCNIWNSFLVLWHILHRSNAYIEIGPGIMLVLMCFNQESNYARLVFEEIFLPESFTQQSYLQLLSATIINNVHCTVKGILNLSYLLFYWKFSTMTLLYYSVWLWLALCNSVKSTACWLVDTGKSWKGNFPSFTCSIDVFEQNRAWLP